MNGDSPPLTKEKLDLDAIARKHCAELFKTRAAKALGPAAEALIIIAFTYGAAWGLDSPDMIDLGNAQLDSIRSAKQ